MAEKLWKVNDIFYSIQGEGYWTGMPMNFIRLSGCNLKCSFCDTDHEHGEMMDIMDIMSELNHMTNIVCITGGEPALQDVATLCYNLKKSGFRTHIESNGLINIQEHSSYYDHVTISPKPNHVMHSSWTMADELKFLCGSSAFPDWKDLIEKHYPHILLPTHLYLQPIWTLSKSNNIKHINEAVNFVKYHPGWRLSLQTHKMIGDKT